MMSPSIHLFMGVNGTTAQEHDTLYNIGAGALFPKASLNEMVQRKQTPSMHSFFAPKELEGNVPMGSAMTNHHVARMPAKRDLRGCNEATPT